jgi:putative transcriptional regulator
MIRYRLRERIADKEFSEGRRITLEEVAAATGISRTTLTRISNQRSYSTSTDVLSRLCAYFHCQIADLVEYVPDA